MNFEIAPRDKWLAETPYDQGAMYCLFLEIDGKKGWRLPTNEEADMLVNIVDPGNDFENPEVLPELEEFNSYWFDADHWGFWTHEDTVDDYDLDELFTAIPVRDII
jgi:hypothetical protein